MSETIKRFNLRRVAGDGIEDMVVCRYSDHQQSLAAAVAAERDRCRREEVEPLKKAVKDACENLNMHRLFHSEKQARQILDIIAKIHEQLP